MRTRAFFLVLLGLVLLAGVLAVDLIAHVYTSMQGAGLQFLRTLVQALAYTLFLRSIFRLFFRTEDVLRPDELADAVERPVRLIRRFSLILGVSVVTAFLPDVFQLVLAGQRVPVKPTTVISIEVIGLVWALSLIFVVLSFWQLLFVRHETHTARRRFLWWAVALASAALIHFLVMNRALPTGAATFAVLAALGLIVLSTALLLGYRLPWLPYVTREGKRQLLIFSIVNVLIAVAGIVLYSSNDTRFGVFNYYSLYWHTVALGIFATIAIYFTLVLFSTLFSLSSTELVERKAQEVRSLARLTRFSSDVLSSELLLDLPKLAEQITSLAAEATDADSAWLELYSPRFAGATESNEEVIIRAHINIDEETAERIMTSAEGFPEASRTVQSPRAEIYASRKAFMLRRRASLRQQLKGRTSREDMESFKSLLAVPLVRRNEVRGGLYVATVSEEGFDDDDLTILAAFSDVASLALETGRLLADSIEKQKFDGELRAARQMQKSLLPDRFPQITGFDVYAVSIPAYDVGGDYYDSSVLWDGAPIMVIGDVSGKGISASIYMAETKGVVQALAPIMSSMNELLEGTNTALLRNNSGTSEHGSQSGSLRRSFVTLGLVSFHRNIVRYCRAGHTPMLYVRANGEYEFIQPKGMAVGLMRQTLFTSSIEQRELHTEEGDLIVLFSDGITDARNENGEEFGYHRLAELVKQFRGAASAKEITEQVIERVALFTGSGQFGDDATLVVIRRRALPDSITEFRRENQDG